eukprot:jgi/Psemu1/302383/fgenesh1_kg.67_\
MTCKSVIERILHYGADPRRRPQLSPHSTPLELAMKHYDRCRIKAKGAQDSGRPVGYIQAQNQICAEAKAVLDALEHTEIPQRMH